MADETPRTKPSPLAAADALVAAPPRRRRWLRALVVLAAAVVALVVLAPTLLSLGIVRGYVLDQVNARLPVVVGVEDWSFSWFGSQRVYGVSAAMAGDPPFATAQELVLDEGLVGLLADRKRTGPVRVRGGEVWTDRTKRLRDELAGPPEAPKPPTEEPEGPLMPVVPASVEFEALTVHAGASGTIRLASALYTTGPEKDTLRAEAEFDYHPAPGAAGSIAPGQGAGAPAPADPAQAAAAAPAPAPAHGKVSVQAELEGLSADWQGAGRLGARGTVTCETLPLAALWAMAADFGLPLGGDGALSADATFARTRAGDVSVQARCAGSNLRVWGVPAAAAPASADGAARSPAAGPPAAEAPADLGPLKGDVVVLETLDLTVDAAAAGRVLTVKALDLKTPVATARASGTFALAASDPQPATGKGTAVVSLQVAPVARMLPATLGLHKDVVVEGGAVSATVAAASDAKVSSLQVEASVTGLGGRRDGKPIALSDGRLVLDLERDHAAPLAAPSGAGAAGSAGDAGKQAAADRLALLKSLRIKRAQVDGAFGSVKASGRMEALVVDADLRLAAATDEVGRFVDLKGYGAAGAATAHLETKGTLEGGLQLAAATNLADLVIRLGPGGTIKEPQATLTAQGSLTLDAQGRLATAAVSAARLQATSATAEASGSASRDGDAWVVDATAKADGEMANLVTVAGAVLPLVAGDAAPPAAKAAAEPATDWRRIVTDVLRSASAADGRPAEGRWSAGVSAKGRLDREVAFDVTTAATDLGVDLAKGRRWQDKRAGLAAAGTATFDAKGGLASMSVSRLRVDGAGSRVEGKGSAVARDGRWVVDGAVDGEAALPEVAHLADLVLPIIMAEAPAPAAGAPAAGAAPAGASAKDAGEKDAADWMASARDVLGRMARGADGRAAPSGRLVFSAKGGGDLAESVGAEVSLDLADLVVPPPAAVDAAGKPVADEPLRLAAATLKADGRYAYGEARRVTVNSLALTAPGLSVKVEAPGTVAFGDKAIALEGSPKASVAADLAALAKTLTPLHLLPAEPALAGTVEVQVSAVPGAENLTQTKLAAVARDLDLRWADGRQVTETFARVSADAALRPDAAGTIAQVDVANWSVKVAAGSLEGTAAAALKNDAWTWRADATGEGPLGPLARTVAGLQGKPPQAIRGLWSLKGAYDAAERTVSLTAGGSNIEIPQEADPPKPAIRLADARLVAQAAIGKDGAIDVRRAELTGPGIQASAKGVVRLPSETAKAVGADGSVKADLQLADLAQALRPFGVLPEGTQLKGAVALTAEAKTGADGITGVADLNLADFEARFAESGGVIRETKAQVPVAFTYEPDKRRWDVVVKDMKSETATGRVRVALTETDADPLLQIRAEVTLDGRRLREALGKDLPATVKLSGPYRVVASLAGPLATTSAAPVPARTRPAAPAAGAAAARAARATASPAPGVAAPGADAPAAAPGAAKPKVPWNLLIAGLTGEGTVGVDRFEYETLTGGQGTITWQMADGQIVLGPKTAQTPSRVTIAGGAVNVAGRILLCQTPPRFIIDERLQVVEGLPVDGEEVRQYLKYASPVLAASVRAKGRFTMVLDALNLPLGEGAADTATAQGAYRIDGFQTELIGPIGRLLQVGGGQAATPVGPFGPVAVTMAGGVLTIEEHDLQYTSTLRLRFGGTIDVRKHMNVVIGIPMNEETLKRFKVSEAAMPYLKDTVMAVPLKGTIDKPEIDEAAVGKRIAALALEAIKRQTLERLGDWLKKPK